MKKVLFILLFIIGNSIIANAQNTYDTIVLPEVIFQNDTLEEIILNPLQVNATKLEKVDLEQWQMRYLREVYPYALRTARLTKKINDDLKKIKTNRERKRYLNECEKVMRGSFEETLKNLTRKQGQYLILLINRETGQTVYDLLKEYRSGWKAFWWNFGGKFFQLNMKDKYDPIGEHKQIENYIQRLEYIYHTDGTNYIIQNEEFNTQNKIEYVIHHS